MNGSVNVCFHERMNVFEFEFPKILISKEGKRAQARFPSICDEMTSPVSVQLEDGGEARRV